MPPAYLPGAFLISLAISVVLDFRSLLAVCRADSAFITPWVTVQNLLSTNNLCIRVFAWYHLHLSAHLPPRHYPALFTQTLTRLPGRPRRRRWPYLSTCGLLRLRQFQVALAGLLLLHGVWPHNTHTSHLPPRTFYPVWFDTGRRFAQCRLRDFTGCLARQPYILVSTEQHHFFLAICFCSTVSFLVPCYGMEDKFSWRCPGLALSTRFMPQRLSLYVLTQTTTRQPERDGLPLDSLCQRTTLRSSSSSDGTRGAYERCGRYAPRRAVT